MTYIIDPFKHPRPADAGFVAALQRAAGRVLVILTIIGTPTNIIHIDERILDVHVLSGVKMGAASFSTWSVRCISWNLTLSFSRTFSHMYKPNAKEENSNVYIDPFGAALQDDHNVVVVVPLDNQMPRKNKNHTRSDNEIATPHVRAATIFKRVKYSMNSKYRRISTTGSSFFTFFI